MEDERKELLLRYGYDLDERLEDWCDFLGTNKTALIVFCTHKHLNHLAEERRKDEMEEKVV